MFMLQKHYALRLERWERLHHIVGAVIVRSRSRCFAGGRLYPFINFNCATVLALKSFVNVAQCTTARVLTNAN